ncbi:hypothetical protein DEU56DRAFT_762603, partial [Suillus clintonianus]|uniref:uncharacterized protein n=1 Tax=Suillus clintonianus TaxID=1904413 RepID=UPI001B86E493
YWKNIRASGVEELTCMGFCDGDVSPSVTGLAQIQACVGPNTLKAFDASSRTFFSPKLLPFTIQTIRLSRCLEKLRLSSVKLSSAQWDTLLCHFAIPTLIELRVDGECAPPTLIRFLARHPAISTLSVIPPPGGPWRANRIITPLTLSLSILDGPLSHLLPVLRSHSKPQNLACLYISLQAHNPSPDYITSVLQCVSYCDSIGHLVLSLPNGHSSAAMMCLSGAHSMVRIKHLVIDYSDGSVPGAAGDPLALSAAWIQALPQVKRVTLRGYSATAAGDLLHIMRSFAAGDVELAVDLHVSPDRSGALSHRISQINDMPSRMFFCKCARCCEVGGDGIPGNPGGKEVPIAQKTIHLLQDADLPSSSEREASVLHLARQQLEPNTSQVDDLAAELFAITLTDNDANPDSHSKLWNSRSEVQQDKGKVYHSLDGTARFTEDDAQHIALVLQAAEKRRQSKAQAALDIVESRIDRARGRIFSATSSNIIQTIRDELAVIKTALRKVKHKVSCIVSRRSQLEASCDDMHRLLCDKEDALTVSSEPLEFDSYTGNSSWESLPSF